MFNPDGLFKLLADDTRARCVMLICGQGELCVCELTFALKLSQPKISRHLALLRDAQLLVGQRRGQWVFYHLNPDLPQWVTDLLALTVKANVQWLEENTQALCVMPDRPNCCPNE